MPARDILSVEEQLRHAQRERDVFETSWLDSRQELAALKAKNKIVQACSAEIGVANKIVTEGWNRVVGQTGSTRPHCEYVWSEEKKSRKRVYDDMHLHDQRPPPPTALYAPDRRPRRPDGTFRPAGFVDDLGNDRDIPQPAVPEVPHRGDREVENGGDRAARDALRPAAQCARDGSRPHSPPPSANVRRMRTAEGSRNEGTSRPCQAELTRKEHVEVLSRTALADLLRTGMTGHDYAVFRKKMEGLREFGPG